MDAETLSQKLLNECKWKLGRDLKEEETELVHWIVDRQCKLFNIQKKSS